ncbi:hypothetical protein LCGC14_2210500, partial [marine sediment metagenome]
MEQHILITFKGDYIVDFIKKNPVSFYGKGKTERGTPGGDLFPPTPIVGLFIRLIHGTEDLFTQFEYSKYCVKTLNNEHGGWFNGFNKAQQDAFLPHVESGAITLFGATTENPSFEINNALLS